MNGHPSGPNGLESIIQTLEMRYEIDANGRLAGVIGGGSLLPRFVLGRAREGCVWRLGAHLEARSVVEVARLAGREPGFPIAGKSPMPPPERLVMIERLLAPDAKEIETKYEMFREGGDVIAEIWSIE